MPVMKPAFGLLFPGTPISAFGVAEVHVVEDVLGLHAELQVPLAAEAEPLEQRGVHVPVAGTVQRVALQVAEGAAGGPAEGAARRSRSGSR